MAVKDSVRSREPMEIHMMELQGFDAGRDDCDWCIIWDSFFRTRRRNLRASKISCTLSLL